MGVAALTAALAIAVSPVSFVQSHASNGAFAERQHRGPIARVGGITCAAGADAPGSLAYLQGPGAEPAGDERHLARRAQQEALGVRPDALLARLRAILGRVVAAILTIGNRSLSRRRGELERSVDGQRRQRRASA